MEVPSSLRQHQQGTAVPSPAQAESSEVPWEMMRMKMAKDGEGGRDEEEEEEDKTNKQLKPKKKNQKRQRQARFAFMTKNEVDHLDDGYRWRKYGQQAVKNSPHPRSTHAPLLIHIISYTVATSIAEYVAT
ncbi:hypothetical protein CRG98_006808 [Punica granatum]|uniref:WRKY domain-containing protein n=1 Tax=Punica granatum TaxID=22663 RepID=A0A2I0KWK0_PUNGR|nr:hypothetical protein CRG98_006808 [Punica granatum]